MFEERRLKRQSANSTLESVGTIDGERAGGVYFASTLSIDGLRVVHFAIDLAARGEAPHAVADELGERLLLAGS